MTGSLNNSDLNRNWLEASLIYLRRPVLAMLFLGFAAGLPFLLVFSTLSAWLTDAGVTRTAIGFFGWVGITYSIKVLWAPVVDRLPIYFLSRSLGQRRSWMLLGQIGIATGLCIMATLNPAEHLYAVALAALLVAFSSSTQDVALDAFRIEAVVLEYQGAMSAAYIFGYRLALLVAGAGALLIADSYSWSFAYFAMAALMLVGVITVFCVAEPEHQPNTMSSQIEARLDDQVHGENRVAKLLRWFAHAVVAPFIEFFQRNGGFAVVILAFIALFRLSDITMGIMANPFYLDLGFSKTEIASVAKLFGFVMTIAGSFICGLWVLRWGVYRPLLIGAVLVASTNLLFVYLSYVGADIFWLTVVISADNLSGGISNTAFVAYLSGLTNRAYTATQYALFSSLMTLPGKVVSGFSGIVVDNFSYPAFFSMAALLGIPAIILVCVLMWHEGRHPSLSSGE